MKLYWTGQKKNYLYNFRKFALCTELRILHILLIEKKKHWCDRDARYLEVLMEKAWSSHSVYRKDKVDDGAYILYSVFLSY